MALPVPYGTDALSSSGLGGVGNSRYRQGAPRVTPYPSPFFDVSRQYMPKSIKELFRHCAYYARSVGLVATVLNKLSTYAVTDLVLEEDNPGVRGRWEKFLFEDLRLKSFYIESNMDRLALGNSFVSVHEPFVKMLRCPGCGRCGRADTVEFKMRQLKFWVESCPALSSSCSHTGEVKAEDWATRAESDIRLIRWDPANIDIVAHEVTGQVDYYLTIPERLKTQMLMGRRDVVVQTPQAFFEAAVVGKALRFRKGSIYHLKRPSIVSADSAWGDPLILPALQKIFMLSVHQKAQEAVLFGHILPMRVLHPVAASGQADPWNMVNLSDWREKVSAEIRQQRIDPNHIALFPLPVGYQNIGGEGKALMLSNEIRVWAELIVTELGIPPELIFSGLSFSGSNVSLRMLENDFLRNQEDNIGLFRFIVKRVSSILNWKPIAGAFKPFKMADDLQRAAFDLQMVGQKMLSKRNLLEQRDHNPDAEKAEVERELDEDGALQRRIALQQAESAGQAQLVTTRYQIQAQAMMQEAAPMVPNGQPGPVDPAQNPEQAPLVPGQEPQPGGPMLTEPTSPQPAVGPGGLVGLESPLTQQSVGQAASAGPLGSVPDVSAAAAHYARSLSGLSDAARAAAMGQLRLTAPSLHMEVTQMLARPNQAVPLPEQRAPRRGPGTAQI